MTANPISVAYIIWSLGLGGAEQVVIRLAAGLDRKRFSPLIFCLDEPGPFAEQAIRHGIEVIALHKRGPLDAGVILKLARLLRRHRVAIVHSHLWGANFWARLAARSAGVAVVIAHEHGMQPWRGGFHFLCDFALAPITHRILFASSQVMREYVKRSGVAPSRCRVIANGVSFEKPLQDRASLRRQRGWREEERIVLCVGRLSPEKGQEDLLKAFARVRARFPQARLVLVGEGPQRAILQELQSRCGLNGGVSLAGLQSDVGAWLAAADVYIQPSRREGLPLAILEAMAAGLPVIATQVGDVGSLITHERNGYLVPPSDPAAMAERLTSVLQHLGSQGPIAEEARRLVAERYSFERMVRSIEALYDEELQNE